MEIATFQNNLLSELHLACVVLIIPLIMNVVGV